MNTNIIIVIIVAIVVAIGAFFFLRDGDEVQTPAGGISEETTTMEDDSFDKVPSFAFEDYEGNEVSSADFEGKILVVNSWATWCPFCVDELTDFGQLQEEFPDEIVVIAIDRSEPLDRAKGFSDNLDVSDKYIFLLDPRDEFYRSIGGFAMPETLFVDTDGNIRVHKRGPMNFNEMKEKVESILNS